MNFPSHPYQPFPKPLPPVPSQNLGPFCLTIDGKWIPYLLGAISALTAETTWESDIYRATGEARNLLDTFAAAIRCPLPDVGGIEGDCDMGCCLRIQNGVLQQFSCGVWQDIGDIKAIAAGAGQPAQGAPQPGPGQCESFIGKVLYGGRWLSPVAVSTNDTFEVSNALGAVEGYLNDLLLWRCGDGLEFIAGGCVIGTEVFDSTNPMPAVARDSLIAFDGTNYYDCGQAANSMVVSHVIPPGISNARLAFLINNAAVGGAGDITFDVRVCRAVASPFSITYVHGTGPANAGVGQVVTMTSVQVSGENTILADVSPNARMTIVGVNGYTFHSGGVGANAWAYTDPLGTVHDSGGGVSGDTTIPFPPSTALQNFSVSDNYGVASPYTIQVRFDAI